jgi:Holliday junction resolvasome RuvABC DNA-binding subunit
MNRLTAAKRAQVINCFIEGCSIRATVRITGISKKTAMRLLVEVGEVCAQYQDFAFRNLQSKRLQLDEMCGLGFIARRRTGQRRLPA